MDSLKNCSKHNQPVIVNDLDPQKEAYCLICMQETPGMTSSDSCLQKLKVIINQADEQLTQDNKLLLHWHNNILNYKGRLINNLDMILKFIMDQAKIFGAFKQRIKKLSQIEQKTTADELQQEFQDQKQKCEQIKHQIKQQLQDFYCKHFLNIDELLPSFNLQQKRNEVDQIKFQYELIKESCREEQNICTTFTFNKNSSLLAVGCDKEIIIYDFNKGQIKKELQRLANHSKTVTCLHFMNKTNTFVSGSEDQSIIIWEYDYGKDKYFAKEILNDHNKKINYILTNKDEDLLITGSIDQTIKFWNKINNIWSCRQTINMNCYILTLSLNDLEDKLIVCGCQKVISILIKGNDNEWSIVQTINTILKTLRLCFTIGDQFIFLPFESDKLLIYNFNKQVGKFEILNNINIQCQYQYNSPNFPCQYLKEIQIFSVQNGSKILIFKSNYDGNYQLVQSIEFYHHYVFGRLTHDGQYLVTWDFQSKQIQVRELKYQSQ